MSTQVQVGVTSGRLRRLGFMVLDLLPLLSQLGVLLNAALLFVLIIGVLALLSLLPGKLGKRARKTLQVVVRYRGPSG